MTSRITKTGIVLHSGIVVALTFLIVEAGFPRIAWAMLSAVFLVYSYLLAGWRGRALAHLKGERE